MIQNIDECLDVLKVIIMNQAHTKHTSITQSKDVMHRSERISVPCQDTAWRRLVNDLGDHLGGHSVDRERNKRYSKLRIGRLFAVKSEPFRVWIKVFKQRSDNDYLMCNDVIPTDALNLPYYLKYTILELEAVCAQADFDVKGCGIDMVVI